MLLERYIKELLLEAPQIKLGDLMKHPGKFLLGKEYKSYWDLSNEEFKTFYPNEDLSKRGPFFNCIKLCFDEFLSNENDPEFDVAEHVREMIIYINALYDFKSNENVAPIYAKFIADGYNGFEELKQTYESIYEFTGPKNLNSFNNPSYISLIKSTQTQYLFDTPDHTLNGLLAIAPSTTAASIFWARTNAQGQKIVLTKTNPNQEADGDYISWCTGRADESNMFNSYFIRGGTTLFYFLPVNDLEGVNKFCIGVTKITNPNDKRKKNYSLICGGHTAVGFENKAFIPEGSSFESDQIQQKILDKFGSSGLTQEMLDIIIEKVAGRNPFDKYAYIGGLKPAEFAATVNMNTIGRTRDGRVSIKQQIETILDLYKDPEFLKQYAPNPKIIAIIKRDIRYFTECKVSMEYLDSKYSSDPNFWNSFVDDELQQLINNENTRYSNISSAKSIANALSKTGNFSLNIYKNIVDKVINTVVENGLESKLGGEFFNDFFASIPLEVKSNMGANDLKELLNLQLDVFKKFNNSPMSIRDFLFNVSPEEIGNDRSYQTQEVLNKLFDNFDEFLNLIKEVSQEEGNSLGLSVNDLIFSKYSFSMLIPSQWFEEDSFSFYLAGILAKKDMFASMFINRCLSIIREEYKMNCEEFYKKNPEFSEYVLPYILSEVYYDYDSFLTNNKGKKKLDFKVFAQQYPDFKIIHDIYYGFKPYLENSEIFRNVIGYPMEEFINTLMNPESMKSILPVEDVIAQMNAVVSNNKNFNNEDIVRELTTSIELSVLSLRGSNQTAQIKKIYEALEKYQNPDLYNLIQGTVFNPRDKRISPHAWATFLVDIFRNPNNCIFKWEENGIIYDANQIIEERKDEIYNLRRLNKIINQDLGMFELYEEIVPEMLRITNPDDNQITVNILHVMFPIYDHIPNDIRELLEYLLADAVSPWQNQVNERLGRKYILGNKILSERQFRKLISHLL